MTRHRLLLPLLLLLALFAGQLQRGMLPAIGMAPVASAGDVGAAKSVAATLTASVADDEAALTFADDLDDLIPLAGRENLAPRLGERPENAAALFSLSISRSDYWATAPPRKA